MSIRNNNNLIEDNSDGILCYRQAGPVHEITGKIVVYKAYYHVSGKKPLFLVFIGNKAYHSECKNKYDAARQAIHAFRAWEENMIGIEHVNDLKVWLTEHEPFFTKQDAQDAGFCKIGVDLFWEKMNWIGCVNARQVLDALSCVNEEAVNTAAVAYSCYKKQYAV